MIARKLTRAGLLILGLAGAAPVACSPVKPFVPEPSQIPHGQGRLWQVDGPGIEPSYIFATYDDYDDRVQNLPPEAGDVFDKSKVVALEVVDDPYFWQELFAEENLQMSGDRTLSDLIGARSYGSLSWHMKQGQRRPNDKAKPWLMWYYLGGEHFGIFEYDYKVDSRSEKDQMKWLEDRAAFAGKKIVALQTQQEIFDIYDKMPLELQAELLKERVDRLGDRGPEARKLQFYLEGDLASLDAVWREYLSWLPPAAAKSLDDRRINDRNVVMVERLLPQMSEQSTFVAVGYALLPGERGMLRLLEQQGYTVTPLL